MTIAEFAVAAARLRREYGASETSGGRTDTHDIAVGGFAGGPHTWDLARDWIYGTLPNRPGSEGHPRSPFSCPHCSTPELKLIHEHDHDHVQPADFPSGAVTFYEGLTREAHA